MGQISENILLLLQEQHRHELANSFRYLERASWARFAGFEATGDFFENEAEGERGHADKVRKYIEDRNEMVKIAPLSYVDTIPASFPELFLTALEVERETTEKLNTLYAEAFRMGDFMTCGFIQSMINEQVEEENLYQTIIDRLTSRGTEMATNHDIDVWIGERE
jgi:ferritin